MHIESSQGRVIDMAGDSVLAVFETATGAVSAALAVQAELGKLGADLPEVSRMRFRIGMHLGDVIEKADGTVYGDGVNIAARLEGLAEPGGVTVSESIRTAVKGKVNAEFEDQGEQQVKNIADPVRAYAVKAVVDTLLAITGRGCFPAGGRLRQPASNRGAAVRQPDGRPRPGVLRRRPGRGHPDPVGDAALAAGDRTQLQLRLQGAQPST